MILLLFGTLGFFPDSFTQLAPSLEFYWRALCIQMGLERLGLLRKAWSMDDSP
jgi:hypothetical protein